MGERRKVRSLFVACNPAWFVWSRLARDRKTIRRSVVDSLANISGSSDPPEKVVERLKRRKKFENVQKSISTRFHKYAAPESWSKYTAYNVVLI